MKRISIFLLGIMLFVFACSDEEENSFQDVSGDAISGDAEQAKEDYAFIVNAAPDYKSATFSVMKISDGSVIKDKDVIHTDAVARSFNDLIYVVNRFGADNITVLDPKKDFAVVKQFSVGAGSNPQDVAVYKDKLFVSKQLSNTIEIYSTSDYSKTGGIDISKYADADGNAEPQDFLIYKDKLYLTVLRLDKDNYYAPTDKSYLLVIDPASSKIEKEIELGATNPFAGLALDAENERIFIAETGSLGVNDGRIEFYSISSGLITQQIIPESEWGGDLNKIAYAKNKIFAVISDANFNTVLKSYDLVGSKMTTLYLSNGFSLAGISVFDDSELYLCDRDSKKPGLRIFNVDDLSQKTKDPVDTGLPPVSLVFFRM